MQTTTAHSRQLPPYRKQTMPTFVQTADGVRTVFKCLTSALPKFARVQGKVVTPQSTNATSVTFATPPPAGVAVEIMYGEIRTVVDASPGSVSTPPNSGGAGETLGGAGIGAYGNYPLPSVFNTAESIAPPVINYVGSTDQDVVFILDPNAAVVTVRNGTVLSTRR